MAASATALTAAHSPAIPARAAFALVVAFFAAIIVNYQYDLGPDAQTDFGMIWHASNAVLEGRDPYGLIGPGLEFNYLWNFIYPLPAAVSIIPLAPFSERVAATVFVGISAGLLAFGMTRSGWYLVPLLMTEAFISACRLGQWSLILTAALFFPVLGLFAIAKPQASLPVLAASRSASVLFYALAGAVLLILLSFLMLPGWVSSWIGSLQHATPLSPPIARPVGILIALVMMRWRRPEAWLIMTLACLPQSVGWYGTLPLLTIPSNVKESVLLAATSALGVYLGGLFVPDSPSLNGLFDWTASLIVATVYLPAVLIVLRRPNIGPAPAWLSAILSAKGTASRTEKTNAGV